MKTTITTRSRNIGYAWTTDVSEGEHYWYVAAPERPQYVGTVRTVLRAMVERTHLISPGTYYADRLFVGGVPVRPDRWGINGILNEVLLDGSAEVEIDEVNLDPALSSSQIGKRLGISRREVMKRYHAGELPSAWLTDGGHLRMRESDVERLRLLTISHSPTFVTVDDLREEFALESPQGV